jgi:hypothetical protein
MEDGLFHAPISSKIQSTTKPLGPSLGANRMWTKRNDHAPKNECANHLIYMSKKGSFGIFMNESSLIIILSSLVFIFSPQKNFTAMGP